MGSEPFRQTFFGLYQIPTIGTSIDGEFCSEHFGGRIGQFEQGEPDLWAFF
jgi:hypothetical protein